MTTASFHTAGTSALATKVEEGRHVLDAIGAKVLQMDGGEAIWSYCTRGLGSLDGIGCGRSGEGGRVREGVVTFEVLDGFAGRFRGVGSAVELAVEELRDGVRLVVVSAVELDRLVAGFGRRLATQTANF